MRRANFNTEIDFNTVYEPFYVPEHIAEVRADIRHNFDHYFDTMEDSAWKAAVKFVGAVNSFEDESRAYAEFLDPEALAAYEENPNAFKTAMRRECPIIRHCLNARAEVMKDYQGAFNGTSGLSLLNVTCNIVNFGRDYSAAYSLERFLHASTPRDFGLSGLDDEPYTAPKVIGGGIRSLFLYYLWPHIFPSRSQAGIWALYFLTGRKNYGFRDDSEFLMVENDGTQQNYFYPYDLFVFYARDILLLLRHKLDAAGFPMNTNRRFVYVDCFLQHVASVHANDIYILKPPRERYD